MLNKTQSLFAVIGTTIKLLLFDKRIGVTQSPSWLIRKLRPSMQRKWTRLSEWLVRYYVLGMRALFLIRNSLLPLPPTGMVVAKQRPLWERVQSRLRVFTLSPVALVFLPASFLIFALYRLGYFRILRKICLSILYRSRRQRGALFVICLSYLLRADMRRYSWTVEYEDYRRDGSFLDPKVITGQDRYLGNLVLLRARLYLWLKLASHVTLNRPLVFRCIDAALELDDPVLFETWHNKRELVGLGKLMLKRWVVYGARNYMNTHTEEEYGKPLLTVHEYCYTRSADYETITHNIDFFNRVPRSVEFDPIPLLPAHELHYQYDVAYNKKVTRFEASFTYPQVNAHRIKNARLIHYHGLIISGTDVIERFFHLKDSYITIFCSNYLVKSDHSAILATRKDNLLRVHGPAFFCGFTDNYHHWLIECLPRYAMALDLIEIHGLPKRFLIPFPPAQWQWDTLKTIGIEPIHCLVDSKARTNIKDWLVEVRGFLCDEIIALDLMSFDMSSHPLTIDVLKRRLPAEWFAAEPTRKLLIVRPPNRLMRMHNQKMLVEAAKAYGYEPISPELMSFEQQVRAFSAATHVLGAGGAAFSNLIFTPPSCKTILLAPIDQLHPSTFGPLVSGHEHPMMCVLGESMPTITMPPYVWTVFDYQVEADNLAFILKQVMGT